VTPEEEGFLGALAGLCAQAFDRALAYEDAEAARTEAEAANRSKSEFLATMSHELRTPLNAIQGHAQLLEMGLHGPVTPAQSEALARIGRAQQHLLGLINDVLDYAKLEAGRVEYVVREVSLRAALHDAGEMLAPQMAAAGLTFASRPPDDACLVWADREKLAQVLLNLLSNAAKFTDAGGTVTLETSTSAATPALIRVHVRDTGIGIPPDHRERVFEPFVQVSRGRTRTRDGTGLGLAISRDLARGMNGDLTVESALGAGSTFTLTLRRVTGASGEPLDRRAREGRRVPRERRAGPDRLPR
jgi:signal transduction histidine kinase